MIRTFWLDVDKNDVVDIAAAIENGDRATARMALDRLLGTETRGRGDALVEWIAQGRAAAAKAVR